MNERKVPEELAELDAELSGVPRAAERRVDPGPLAVGVSGGVLLLVVGLVLPWTGSVPGWEVLAGGAWVGALPRLFAFVTVGIGVLGSALALTLRWWALAWVCAVGSGIGTVLGVLAVWSRQTGVPQGGTGPAIGLVLAVLGTVLLVACWARIAGRRG